MKTLLTRIENISPRFVEFVPSQLERGVLYVSRKYRTASHLCACGCGTRVVTPLKLAGWRYESERGEATLSPSIGNWSLPCRSHYWITRGRIIWAGQWSQQQIDAARRRDREDQEKSHSKPKRGVSELWHGLCEALLRRQR
jgi:hypothetical protein